MNGFKVLVVDDDVDVRMSIAEALVDAGIQAVVAENGLAALELLRTGLRPDVILLDMMMPQMDGWTFRAEQQKEPASAAVPLVVFTAHGSPRDIARELGADAYLKKPLHLEELLTTINRFRPMRIDDHERN